MASANDNASSKPAPLLSDALNGGFVTVEVGPERKRYTIHQALLVYHSDYFRNALRGPWKEATEGVIPLLDIETCTFAVFAAWLYTGTLPDSPSKWLEAIRHPSTDEKLVENRTRISLALLRAYVFGDRFLAPKFRSEVFAAFCDTLLDLDNGGKPSEYYQIVRYAYDNIPADRSTLQLLADHYCDCWAHELDDIEDIQAQKDIPPAFLLRVVRSFSEKETDEKAREEEAAKKARTEETAKKATIAGEAKKSKPRKKNKGRCYEEHLTTEEQEECSKGWLHMRYDKNADYGYFE